MIKHHKDMNLKDENLHEKDSEISEKIYEENSMSDDEFEEE